MPLCPRQTEERLWTHVGTGEGGGAMSEYIVDVGNADEEYIEHFGYMATAYADNPIRELIVRCRDCKFGKKIGYSFRMRCYLNSEYFTPLIKPDGFCAWAERVEQ